MGQELKSFFQVTWGTAAALQVALVVILVARGLQRRFPALCAYLVLNLLQGTVLVLVYPRFGFRSVMAWRVAWLSEAVVIGARAAAVVELSHKVVARFRGIWALGWRLLALGAATVLVVAIALGRYDLGQTVLTLDLGVELAIATSIVGLFVFAKHYGLEFSGPFRWLGLGFFLYSSVYVLNDLFLQHDVHSYWAIWRHVDMLAFIASVVLWVWAFLKPMPTPAFEPLLLDANVYPALMPEVNRRLVLLNEQLSNIWKVGRHQA